MRKSIEKTKIAAHGLNENKPTERSIVDQFNSEFIQSKFLVMALVNDEILYWKDVYYEVERNNIVDLFINGRWNFNPGTILTLVIYALPTKKKLSSYKVDFQLGMKTVTEEEY